MPLLILLLYAIVLYAYIFVIQQSINYAAQSAAEAAVPVNPEIANYEDVVRQRALDQSATVLSFLPQGALNTTVSFPPPAAPANVGSRVQVNIDFDLATAGIRTLAIPILGNPILPIPDDLQGQGIARVSRTSPGGA